MEKIVITEEQVKKVLDNILTEEAHKVTRQDFNRIQFKIEELENSLNETIKEFTKLNDSIPPAFKNATFKKMNSIRSYLNISRQTINGLKENVRIFKRKVYGQPTQPLQTPEG
jgi:DNA anti-recombination protein RmuC